MRRSGVAVPAQTEQVPRGTVTATPERRYLRSHAGEWERGDVFAWLTAAVRAHFHREPAPPLLAAA